MTDGYWVADLTQLRQNSHKIAVYFRKSGAKLEIVGLEYKW